jgi:putative oxidoreductase
MKFVVLLGRILFSLSFIAESFGHSPKETFAWAAQNGVPMASILVPIAWAFALIGGLSVLVGFKAKIGAWLLAVYTLCIIFVTTKMAMQNLEITGFILGLILVKNLSMLGATFIIAYFGSGPLSLDGRKKHTL